MWCDLYTHQGLKISTEIYPKTFCVQLMLFLISIAKELGVKLCIYLWAAMLLEHNTVHLHHGPTLKYMSGYVPIWVFCYPFLLALVYYIILFFISFIYFFPLHFFILFLKHQLKVGDATVARVFQNFPEQGPCRIECRMRSVSQTLYRFFFSPERCK